MAESLESQRIVHVLQRAVHAGEALVITVRQNDRWVNLASYFTGEGADCLFLAAPTAASGESVPLLPGRSVFLTFREGADKIQAHSTVLPAGFGPSGQTEELAVQRPVRLRRFRRRAARRVNVPDDTLLSAWFWLGDRQTQDECPYPECPAWPGRVLDLSPGGLRLLIDQDAAAILEVGDRVGLELQAHADPAPLRLDAQSRHIQPSGASGESAVVGFCFVGVDEGDPLCGAIERLITRMEGPVADSAPPAECAVAAAGTP